MTTLELTPSSSIAEALASAPEGPVTLILKEGIWREKITVTRPGVTLISEEGARIDNDDRHGTVRDGKVFSTGDSATFTVAAPTFQPWESLSQIPSIILEPRSGTGTMRMRRWIPRL